jgi:hypothetical protein
VNPSTKPLRRENRILGRQPPIFYAAVLKVVTVEPPLPAQRLTPLTWLEALLPGHARVDYGKIRLPSVVGRLPCKLLAARVRPLCV